MVRYSDTQVGHLNSGPVFKWLSEYRSVNLMVIRIPNYHDKAVHLNTKPFHDQTNPHDLNTEPNTELIRNSGPQWIGFFR